MARGLAKTAAVLAATSALVSSCDDQRRSERDHIVSYASHEPGSVRRPTNEASFRLLGAEGPARLEYLRMQIIQSGKQCNFVTSAIFVGGLDGTDEWRMRCGDSGDWSLWFRADGATDLNSCSKSNCE